MNHDSGLWLAVLQPSTLSEPAIDSGELSNCSPECPLCDTPLDHQTYRQCVLRMRGYFDRIERAWVASQERVNRLPRYPEPEYEVEACGAKAEGRESLISGALVEGYASKFFKEIRELGRGSFGYVSLVRHHLEDQELGLYALKRVPVGFSSEMLLSCLQEVKLREHLQDGNLLEYKHSWVETRMGDADVIDSSGRRQNPVRLPWLHILMEFANCGTLDKLTHEMGFGPIAFEPRYAIGPSDVSLFELTVWNVLRQILRGLGFLHRNLLLHRDIKLENLLLDVKRLPLKPAHYQHARPEPSPVQDLVEVLPADPHAYLVRILIGDFGSSVEALRPQFSHGNTGTVEYQAPELWGTRGERDFTPASDLWAVGMVGYCLVMGKLPWPVIDDWGESIRQLRLSLRGWHGDMLTSVPVEPSFKVSSELTALISSLLSFDPSKRPSAQLCLEKTEYAPFWSRESQQLFNIVVGRQLYDRFVEDRFVEGK